MVDRGSLAMAFRDTMSRLREDPELRRRTVLAQAGTQLYLRDFVAVNPQVKREVPEIVVIEDTTFHAAEPYARGEERVAALNFANAYTPGGGVVNGARAQEECLCRCSNLYPCLMLPYLQKNYYKWNMRNTGDMGSDAVIYTPGVTVFRTDDGLPEDLAEWYQVDVITCAAPYFDVNKKKPVTREKLEEVFTGRIRNILEVAAAQDVDVLVLGAFGCGAFHNPPELVAEVFRKLLVDRGYGRFFRKVIFAIKRNDTQNTNVTVFRDVLGQ